MNWIKDMESISYVEKKLIVEPTNQLDKLIRLWYGQTEKDNQ